MAARKRPLGPIGQQAADQLPTRPLAASLKGLGDINLPSIEEIESELSRGEGDR